MIAFSDCSFCFDVAETRNLYMVQSVSSQKLAGVLNREWGNMRETTQIAPLRILLQVNTSGEETKGGVEPGDVLPVVSFILKQCPSLSFCGFMTIGKPGEGYEQDFISLRNIMEDAKREFSLTDGQCLLSMGMSSDYTAAIVHGSDMIRVGTAIFGAREYKSKE